MGMKMSASMKGVLAASIALVAIVLVISVQYGDDAVEEARETMFDRADAHTASHAVKKAAKKAHKAGKKKAHKYVKGENTLRSRIHKALKVAQKSLRHAHGKKQKMAAKAAVKAALADAGVADADNAGTIAWANRNLDAAKKWADHALKRDAKSLGKVAAWKVGDRKTGILMRRKCERAVQSMIAVASATKNKEMVAREDKLRAAGKLKSYDGPIKKARKASRYAGKMVENARAALAATLGTKARIAAKYALLRAQNAMHDANTILRMEMGKKSVITSNRLQSDGARLVGENELHYRCRKTFHRANRVLKLVNAALNHARKNHYAHKEAVMKQTQKITMEKAARLAARLSVSRPSRSTLLTSRSRPSNFVSSLVTTHARRPRPVSLLPRRLWRVPT